MLKHKEGYYCLNLRNLDDDEETAAAEFICSTNYVMMLTGHAPHLLHPLNLLMMLHPDAYVHSDIIKVFPCPKNYLRNRLRG